MWKGMLLGVGLSFVGTIIYLVWVLRKNPAQAVGTTAIMSYTVMNVFYWVAVIVALIAGWLIIKWSH